MNWKNWFKGLGLAVLGASAGSAVAVLNNRTQYGKSAPPVNGTTLGAAAATGAITALVGYLVQSPLPPTQPTLPTNQE